jgi:type VI secretion system secreted protein VgrG
VTRANHTKNVLQTGGRNRLEIEDSAGGEYVKWRTPHANTTLHIGAPHNPDAAIFMGTDDDWHAKIGGNIRINADKNVSRKASGSLDEVVLGDTKQDYGADRHETTQGAYHEEMNSSYTQETAGPYTQTIQGTQTVHVTGPVEQAYQAGHTLKVLGKKLLSVQGDAEHAVSGCVKKEYGSLLKTVNGFSKDHRKGNHSWLTVGADNAGYIGVKHDLFCGGKASNVLGVETKINASLQLQFSAISASATLLKMDKTQMSISSTSCVVSSKAPLENKEAKLSLRRIATFLATSDLACFK